VELRDYLQVIRARKWVIIQAVVIVTLVAVVASLLQPKQYEGKVDILVSENDTGASILGTTISEFSSQPDRAMATQVQLMQERPLLENTIRALDLGVAPDELAKRVTIAGVGTTNVVSITVTDSNAQRAARIANTLASEYVTWSRNYKRESIQAAVTEVQDRLTEAQNQIIELGKKIKSSGKSDDLSAELQIATGNYTTLAAKLEDLKVNEQLENGSGSVVSKAAVSSIPVSPSPKRNGALGLAVGLVFGLGMAFLYEYLDNTIKSSEEAEQLYGAPVLGLIPAEKFEKDEPRRLTILTHPGSSAAEAYRVLRNSLDFISVEHEIKTLVVSSAAPAEGKSTVSANLATSLAQAGKRVVLVNCDFRRPTTTEFFDVSTMIGLSDVLAGRNTLKSALQQPHADMDLLVLTAGKMPPNPSEILGSARMQELIKTLGEWSDWVIIDTPPLLAVADAAAVARWSDGVLMVSKGGESVRDAAKKARELMEAAGGHIAGVVVWGLDASSSSGSYGYYYGAGKYGRYGCSDYYNNVPADTKPGKQPSKAAAVKAPTAASTMYIPPVSPGRKFLQGVGKVLTAVLAVVAVLAIVALVVYFLDQAFGWGILQMFLH